jgi:hypothetical protein
MPDLNAAFEDYLASMAEADWQALCARVRPPADNPADEPEPVSPADDFARLVRGKIAPTKGDPTDG